MGRRSKRKKPPSPTRQWYTETVAYYVPVQVRLSRLLGTTERFDGLTRTMVQLGSTLATSVTQSAGFSSKVQGYHIAGWSTVAANRTLIQKMPFATEVFAPAGYSLASARRGHTAVETAGAGYILGGLSDGTLLNDIQKISTETDTLSTLPASLGTARSFTAAAGNTARALIAGGQGSSGVLSSIEELNYGTELIAPVGDSLDLASRGGAGASSNKEAFFAGGTGGTGSETAIHTVNFSTKIATIRGLQLSLPRTFDADSAFSDYLPVS